MKTDCISKDTFIEKMKDYATQYGEVVVQTIVKASGNYTGLFVNRAGEPTPVVNLDALYDSYVNDDESTLWDCSEVIDDILNKKADIPINPKDIFDWNKVKGMLFLRLSSTEIADALSRKVADLYLIPYLQILPDGSASVRVTDGLLAAWGIDEDTVFDQAKANQPTFRPVRIDSISDILGIPTDSDMFVVTTDNHVCGASAILYAGVADSLRERLHGDFYIIPSSIHEVIVISKDEYDNTEKLIALIKKVNQAAVSKEERLSDSLYTYDFDSHELRCVG